MAYFVTAVIVVVLGAGSGMIAIARRESRLVPRPFGVAARRIRRQNLVAEGDKCACGGVVGPSGRQSAKFGPLLGCTGCSRSWTMAGQRLLRRTAPATPQPAVSEDGPAPS
jgi:hypothetical protein